MYCACTVLALCNEITKKHPADICCRMFKKAVMICRFIKMNMVAKHGIVKFDILTELGISAIIKNAAF